MITVYYDGKCGMCSKEISYYKKIAPDALFTWHDVTIKKPEESMPFTQEDALKTLHVIDKQGNLQLGIDAFITIWSQLRYWRYLAMLARRPIIHPSLAWLYNHFAAWRFKHIDYCNVSTHSK